MSEWRSSLNHIDESQVGVREVLNNTYEAMQEAMREIEIAAGFLRSRGGLDAASEQLHKILGLEPLYVRQYHEDGCRIDAADLEFQGHDMEFGCVESEEVEDVEEQDEQTEPDSV